MKLCRNCGQTMADDALYCTVCGAKYEKPVRKKFLDKGMLRRIGVGAAAVLAIVLVVMLISALFSSPAKKFVSYQKAILQKGALGQVVKLIDYANDYSLSTDATLTAESDDGMLDSVLAESAIGFKVDMSKKNVKASGELTIMGTPMVSGMVSYADGKIGFCVPELDETYYTAELAALVDMVGGEFEALEKLEQQEISSRLLKSVVKRYTDIFLTLATKDSTSVDKNGRVRMDILNGSVRGTVYTVQPSAEEIEDMLLKLAETVETDKELRKLALQLSGLNLEAVSKTASKNLEQKIEDYLDDFVDNLYDNAEYIGENLEESDFKWVLGMDGKKPFKYSIEWDNGESKLGFEAKEDSKNAFAFYIIDYYSTTYATVTYAKESDGYSGNLTAGVDDSYMVLEFEDVSNKTSALGIRHGSYSLSLDGNHYSLEVAKGKKGGTDHIVELYMFDTGNLKLVLNTSDKKATIPKPKGKTVDISDYDERELQALFVDWGYAAEELLEELGSKLERTTGGRF